MAKCIFNIAGLGPKKEKLLIESGYSSTNDIKSTDFYNILRLPGFGIHTTYNIFQSLGLQIPCIDMKEIYKTISEPCQIENKTIKPWRDVKKDGITSIQPDDFKIERTTVWSYPKRGDWATHTPQYRGNWPPQVVRNIIELYSKPEDFVLDPMVGGGTTPVECRLLGRNSISVDINENAVNITRDRLNFEYNDSYKTTHRTFVGDARNLNLIDSETIDLVATHPPYANIIHYAPLVQGDLSEYNQFDIFFKEFKRVIKEIYRILKPGKYCAILIGDTHNNSHYVPISSRMMIDFLKEGFILKEDIIKKEWNCESDRYLKKYSGAQFLLTMHEHVLIFRKPLNDKDKLKNSMINFFEE